MMDLSACNPGREVGASWTAQEKDGEGGVADISGGNNLKKERSLPFTDS